MFTAAIVFLMCVFAINRDLDPVANVAYLIFVVLAAAHAIMGVNHLTFALTI